MVYRWGMMLGFHHVAVVTEDLERLVAFYVDHFGGRVLNRFSWSEDDGEMAKRFGLKESAGHLAMVGFEGARIEIFEFRTPSNLRRDAHRSVAKPGFAHICFQVDDAEAEYDRLIKAGMEFHAPPLKMAAGGVFTYGRDPDGNVVEILQPPE